MEQLGETQDLRTIPSAVGGDIEKRHGVILARSIPAKKYKVQTGEPVVHALRKCPNLYLVKPNHKMYHEKSKAFIEILKSYSDQVEQVSVDEAYADVSELVATRKDAENLAHTIRTEIFEKLKFTVNVGISNNKLLAKMASDFEKPNKVHTLYPEEIAKKMWPLPVGDLLFAGKASVKELEKLGIVTIGDLANTDREILKNALKKQGESLWQSANGMDDTEVCSKRQDNKGYGNSTTLSENIVKADEAKKVLLLLSEKVGERLRKDNMVITSVSVGIRFHTLKRISHQMSFSEATNQTNQIYESACRLFDEMWDGTPIRLLAVQTSGAVKDEGFHQMNLFEMDWGSGNNGGENQPAFGREYRKPDTEKQKRLDKALDLIREKYGDQAIKRASVMKKE